MLMVILLIALVALAVFYKMSKDKEKNDKSKSKSNSKGGKNVKGQQSGAKKNVKRNKAPEVPPARGGFGTSKPAAKHPLPAKTEDIDAYSPHASPEERKSKDVNSLFGLKAVLNGVMLELHSDSIPQMSGYVIFIRHEGKFVGTSLDLFRSNDGRFTIVRNFSNLEPKVFNQSIPLNAILAPRNRPLVLTIDVVVMLQNMEYVETSLNQQVYISGEFMALSEWITPLIDIMSYVALSKTGEFSKHAVEDIVYFITHFVNFNERDVMYLKNRLKLNRIRYYELSLDDICAEYLKRGLSNRITLSFVARIMTALVIPGTTQEIVMNKIGYFSKHLHIDKNELIAAIYADMPVYEAIRSQTQQKKRMENSSYYMGTNVERDKDWALDLLDLEKDATKEEMKVAYRKLMTQCHPDRHAHEPEHVREAFKKQAQELNVAKQILDF